MATISKSARAVIPEKIEGFAKTKMLNHYPSVPVSAYEDACFTTQEKATIIEVKRITDLADDQYSFAARCVIEHALFENRLEVEAQYTFRTGAEAEPIAWSRNGPTLAGEAKDLIDATIHECVEQRLNTALFKKAAKSCFEKAVSWEQLGASFPPFIHILKWADMPKELSACMETKRIVPLPLTPAERQLVKYVLDWSAVQLLLDQFKDPKPILPKMMKVYKMSNQITKVTLRGTDHIMNVTV